MVYAFVTISVLVSMLLTITKCMRSRTAYDRMLLANLFGTQTVVLIAVLSVLFDEMLFLDIALVYALINFITTIAFLKFRKDGSFK